MALALLVQPTYGVRLAEGGATKQEWCIHPPQKWRPPGAVHPRMKQLLRDDPEVGILLVPLHLGMWYLFLMATSFECPCPRPRWRRALSTACIAAEGEGTHDWAAVLGEHVNSAPVMQIAEFRQSAGIVWAFVADAPSGVKVGAGAGFSCEGQQHGRGTGKQPWEGKVRAAMDVCHPPEISGTPCLRPRVCGQARAHRPGACQTKTNQTQDPPPPAIARPKTPLPVPPRAAQGGLWGGDYSAS